MNQWPVAGGYLEQTAFTMDLFNYISGIVEQTRERLQKEHDRKNNQPK